MAEPSSRPSHAIVQVASPPQSPFTLPHILLVLDGFPRSLGGGERIALRLAALLPRYGYRASILTLSLHPETTALHDPPCPIYLLSLTRTYDLNALRAAFVLRRFLKQQNIALVQTFFESSDIWAGFVTRVFSPARLIWSRRDMGILRTAKHRVAYRLLARFPHRVFAVSEQVRRHCIDVDHIEASRVQTVYNGFNPVEQASTPSELSPSGGEMIVMAIGNIRRVKGYDILLQAAGIISHHLPNVIFRIGGGVLEEDCFAELQSLVHSLGLSGKVHFLGSIHNVLETLRPASLFVLPSRSEGFSNAILEAMSVALPVVATDVGGNAEAIEDQVTGFIVPPEDPEALAEAILRLLANPSLAADMGAAGRLRVATRFSTDTMMKQVASAYRSLLEAPGASSRKNSSTT